MVSRSSYSSFSNNHFIHDGFSTVSFLFRYVKSQLKIVVLERVYGMGFRVLWLYPYTCVSIKSFLVQVYIKRKSRLLEIRKFTTDTCKITGPMM